VPKRAALQGHHVVSGAGVQQRVLQSPLRCYTVHMMSSMPGIHIGLVI
jgi:hypothetical protein